MHLHSGRGMITGARVNVPCSDSADPVCCRPFQAVATVSMLRRAAVPISRSYKTGAMINVSLNLVPAEYDMRRELLTAVGGAAPQVGDLPLNQAISTATILLLASGVT